jgi:hypothetical protein
LGTTRRWLRPISENPDAARRPVPETGILLTHFIVSDDIERSTRFHADVLGGAVVREGEPTEAGQTTARPRTAG